MKRIGNKTLLSADEVDRAQFDIRHTVDLKVERDFRRHAEEAGLTLIGEYVRQEVPVVWTLSEEEDKTYFLRPAREGERPDGYEFRYHQYAQ